MRVSGRARVTRGEKGGQKGERLHDGRKRKRRERKGKGR